MRKIEKKPDKKKVCLDLSKDLLKEVNLELVKINGSTFGYFTKTVEAGLRLWLEQQEITV